MRRAFKLFIVSLGIFISLFSTPVLASESGCSAHCYMDSIQIPTLKEFVNADLNKNYIACANIVLSDILFLQKQNNGISNEKIFNDKAHKKIIKGLFLEYYKCRYTLLAWVLPQIVATKKLTRAP